MKKSFILTGIVTAIYLLTIAIQSAAVGSFIVNYLPIIAGSYAAAAVMAIAIDDCRQATRRQSGRTRHPFGPAVRPTDPAYAGATWGWAAAGGAA